MSSTFKLIRDWDSSRFDNPRLSQDVILVDGYSTRYAYFGKGLEFTGFGCRWQLKGPPLDRGCQFGVQLQCLKDVDAARMVVPNLSEKVWFVQVEQHGHIFLLRGPSIQEHFNLYSLLLSI